MLRIKHSNSFKKNLKLMHKRGKNMDKFKDVTKLLVNKIPLPPKYMDHKLGGKYNNHRECHVDPDWLVIYRVENETIFFEETGTHSDLF